ncbi:MAG: STAS domain-containing protein [Erysipelotrichaceae bacterium]|nr:STAS domain-containing protein [Erysipelotrichaceae bacterium]
MYKTSKSTKDNVTTLYVEGEINTLSSEKLKAELFGIDNDLVVIDLEKITYITSAGLRIFIEYNSIISSKGHQFKLINAKPEIIDLFNITGLNNILNVEEIK